MEVVDFSRMKCKHCAAGNCKSYAAIAFKKENGKLYISILVHETIPPNCVGLVGENYAAVPFDVNLYSCDEKRCYGANFCKFGHFKFCQGAMDMYALCELLCSAAAKIPVKQTTCISGTSLYNLVYPEPPSSPTKRTASPPAAQRNYLAAAKYSLQNDVPTVYDPPKVAPAANVSATPSVSSSVTGLSSSSMTAAVDVLVEDNFEVDKRTADQ